MITELMDWFSSKKKEQIIEKSVLEQIEELNKKNKEFYDSPNHHKNVVKLFIPFEKPSRMVRMDASADYDKNYVLTKVPRLLQYIKENNLFSKGVMETTEEGVYLALLFPKSSIEVRGASNYYENCLVFEEEYAKEFGMSENQAEEKVMQLYNAKWHYAKISAMQVARYFFVLRNGVKEFKDGSKDYFGMLFFSGEDNLKSYDAQQEENHHLNRWNPKEVKELEEKFKKEDFMTSFWNEKDRPDFYIYDLNKGLNM